MRVHEIHCPKCDTTLKSKAGVPVGQSIACPKCKHRFAVEAEDEPDVVEDEDAVEERRPPRGKGPPPAPVRKRVVRDDDENEDEDEDDERRSPKKPVSARRRRERDDDEEDRPRRMKGRRRKEDDEPDNLYWRLRRNVAVRVITFVVLLGILAVVSYLLYEKKKAEREMENSSLSAPGFAVVLEGAQSVSTGRPA